MSDPIETTSRYPETIRHHLLIALGSTVMAAGRIDATDEIAEHIKAALRLLPEEDADTHG